MVALTVLFQWRRQRWSYVSHKLKHEFGMRPLTVTSRPPLTLSVGNKNLENFVRSGYDHIHVT